MYCFLTIIFTLLSLISHDGAGERTVEILGNTANADELFERLYRLGRSEQMEAVNNLLNLGQLDQQTKMVDAIAEKIFSGIVKSREILEIAGYVPGDTSYPFNDEIRAALSNILQNTAFLSDVILRLPEMSLQVLDRNPEWNHTLKWSLNFANKTRLIDTRTTNLINIVSQELNFTKRSANHTNPYHRKTILTTKEQDKRRTIKKRKMLPRGPKLTSRQLGEL